MATARLTRSEADRVIGGVCGGIAAYFRIDPALVRVAFVVAGLMGWGVVAYLILWIALPRGPVTTPAVRIAEERYARGEITAEELERIRRDLERSP